MKLAVIGERATQRRNSRSGRKLIDEEKTVWP